jgi:hypothetical protein
LFWDFSSGNSESEFSGEDRVFGPSFPDLDSVGVDAIAAMIASALATGTGVRCIKSVALLVLPSFVVVIEGISNPFSTVLELLKCNRTVYRFTEAKEKEFLA